MTTFGNINIIEQTEMKAMPQHAAGAWSIMSNMVGATYKPIAYVGTQIVKGVNHIFIAEQTFVTANPERHIVPVTINEFDGNFSLVSINHIFRSMNIAIIDADLLGRKRHRFPNLCCLKLSGYHKARGDNVTLKLDFVELDSFDRVYIAKVFTDTPIDQSILEKPNVIYGGTGFFYDNAQLLPDDIEHHVPYYHLYDEWAATIPERETKFYREYSIGYAHARVLPTLLILRQPPLELRTPCKSSDGVLR